MSCVLARLLPYHPLCSSSLDLEKFSYEVGSGPGHPKASDLKGSLGSWEKIN